MFPLGDDQPKNGVPIVCWMLIAICVALFVYEQQFISINRYEDLRFTLRYALVPSWLFGTTNPSEVFHVIPTPLRLITHQYLHGSWLHLIGNMLFLFAFGPSLERRCGSLRFFLFYTLAGIAGGLGHAFSVGPGDSTPMLGASGAIAGLQGGYFVLLPEARMRVFIFLGVFFKQVVMPAWVLIGLWFVLQLLNLRAGDGDNVAYMAHIAGCLAGAAMIKIFRDRARDPNAVDRQAGGMRANGMMAHRPAPYAPPQMQNAWPPPPGHGPWGSPPPAPPIDRPRGPWDR